MLHIEDILIFSTHIPLNIFQKKKFHNRFSSSFFLQFYCIPENLQQSSFIVK